VELKSKTEQLDAQNGTDIARAAEILRRGGTVAFPTETVYGLGANALSSQAVARIFEAKKRPGWDPLIVHVSDATMLGQVADLSAAKIIAGIPLESPFDDREDDEFFDLSSDGPRFIRELVAAFWPGPLTLLLPRTPAIPDAVTAGRPLVGVRMPAHPIALELIRQAGVPIAAPSANLFGHTSPTTAAHVLDDLDGRIDAVLDGGATDVGLESTVAAITRYGVTVYRPGAITVEMLDAVLGGGVAQLYQPLAIADEAPEALPSPGLSVRHYAPKARVVLVGGLREEPLQLHLVDAIDQAFDGSARVGVMLPDGWNASCAQLIFRWGPWHDPAILAQRLYTGLRELDDRGATVIVCPVPGRGDGLAAAIRDRLGKAAK